MADGRAQDDDAACGGGLVPSPNLLPQVRHASGRGPAREAKHPRFALVGGYAAVSLDGLDDHIARWAGTLRVAREDVQVVEEG